MTKRKPLQWYDTGHGQIPSCDKCGDLWFSPWFSEAVSSVSIEHPGDPASLAARTVEKFHADRHPAGWLTDDNTTPEATR